MTCQRACCGEGGTAYGRWDPTQGGLATRRRVAANKDSGISGILIDEERRDAQSLVRPDHQGQPPLFNQRHLLLLSLLRPVHQVAERLRQSMLRRERHNPRHEQGRPKVEPEENESLEVPQTRRLDGAKDELDQSKGFGVGDLERLDAAEDARADGDEGGEEERRVRADEFVRPSFGAVGSDGRARRKVPGKRRRVRLARVERERGTRTDPAKQVMASSALTRPEVTRSCSSPWSPPSWSTLRTFLGLPACSSSSLSRLPDSSDLHRSLPVRRWEMLDDGWVTSRASALMGSPSIYEEGGRERLGELWMLDGREG